jgi:nucleoside-diphosphate-sugar epimerase
LVALGADVHSLSRRPNNGKILGTIWQGDLLAHDQVREIIMETRPQIVYHLAGKVTGEQDVELVLPTLHTNLIGMVHLLLALLQTGCERVIVVGSSEEPDLKAGQDIPVSPYAAAKAAANLYARMFYYLYNLPIVLVRPFMVYGPRQATTKLIPYTIIALLRKESPRLSSGRRVCDFVYVLDVIRGLLKAGVRANIVGKTFELGTGKGISIRKVVEVLTQLIGGNVQPVFGAIPDRVGERDCVADAMQAGRELGWEPKWSLREGLAETVAWYRRMLREGGKS